MIDTIVRPVTGDGLCGFDKFNQFWVYWPAEDRGYAGSIMPDVREKKCAICGQGWECTSESLRNQYFTRVTDEFVHETCYVGYLAMEEAGMFYHALCEARGQLVIVWHWKKIPNEYRGSWNTPWYRVRFEGYVPYLKIGSRKRVYHMSMHDLRSDQVAAFEKLVEREESTKGAESDRRSVYIHAWTREDVRRYLEIFYKMLTMDQPQIRKDGAQVYEIPLKSKPEEPRQLPEPQEPKQNQIDPTDGRDPDSNAPRLDAAVT